MFKGLTILTEFEFEGRGFGIYSSTPSPTIHDNFILESPLLLISGYEINPRTGQKTRVINKEVSNNIYSLNSKTFVNPSPFYFYGDITISFSTSYSLRSYSDSFKNENNFVGTTNFEYQKDKAEIKYTLDGSLPLYKGSFTTKTYKEPFILKNNTSGSDNTIIKYKLFYEGKSSIDNFSEIHIVKTSRGFYKT